jgi:hypothetical protein
MYSFNNTALLGAIAFYIYKDKDVFKEDDYHLFLIPNWEDSTVETILFDEAPKLISNLRKGQGKDDEFNDPVCIIFNLITIEIDPENIVIKSIGFSAIPLQVEGVGALQGYFHLPIYREPFTYDLMQKLLEIDPWQFVTQFSKNDQEVSEVSATMQIRLYLPPFEVALA